MTTGFHLTSTGTVIACGAARRCERRAAGARTGGGMAQGLGISLFAFGGAYWPLATAHSDPLWVRTCFGCVNGAPGCIVLFDFSRFGCPGDGLLPVPLTRCIQMHTPSPCKNGGGVAGGRIVMFLGCVPPFLLGLSRVLWLLTHQPRGFVYYFITAGLLI